MERRCKPRIACSYPATVRGTISDRLRYETPAILANISACGVYLRLKKLVPRDETVFIEVRMSTAPLGQTTAPHIAAIGKVVRIETLPDGYFGIGVQLSHYRML